MTMTTETVKRPSKASVTYVRDDGTVSNFPLADTPVIRTEFANGMVRIFDTRDPRLDPTRPMAEKQGFVTRFQRSYNAEKDIDLVIEAYDETSADLFNGVWIESKTGEAKVTQLSMAIVKTLEGDGETVDENRRLSIIEKLKDAAYREKANANAHVQANLQALRLEAQKKRATEAQKVAKETGKISNLADF